MLTRDDERLVRDAVRGSKAAKGELFRRHWRAVWQRAYAISGRRSAADDIAQDAFERAFRSLESFEGASSFGTWIQRIAVNRALDLLRSERRLTSLEDVGEIAVYADEPGGDRELQAAVARLPADRRVALVLRYWLDCSPGEIAEMLDIPAGTVHSRLARGLADLRMLLEGAER